MNESIAIPWSRYLLPPLHKEGPRFLVIFAVLALILFWIWTPLIVVGVIGLGWCYFFFRDPVRYVPNRPGLVVSPASGVAQMIGEIVPPGELDMGEERLWRVSIFMSVFDCHVNRAPVAGTVSKVSYTPGKFLAADHDRASGDNERNAVKIRAIDDREVACVQIAGLLARRIRCDVREGQETRIGGRFGLIRFGSRVDVYLPKGVKPLVVLGQNCVSGETILADFASDEDQRRADAF